MDSGAVIFAALLLISYGISPILSACNTSVAGAQLDSLLAEYDREAPPAGKVSLPLTFDLRHASIDEKTSTVKIMGDLHMSWQDSRIKWNATEWGCDWALAAAERLWLPDISLINAAAVSDLDPLRARVTNTGAVTWTMRLDVSVPVTLNLADWPEDVQTADFMFASREFTQDQLELSFKKKQTIMPYDSGAWEVIDAKSGSAELLLVTDDDTTVLPENASDKGMEYRAVAALRVSLRRRSPAQSVAARVAVAAALLLLVGAALLPPTDRAPLAATAAFTLAVWLCSAAWRVSGGAGVPRAVQLCGGVCGCAGAAAVAAALVARVAKFTTPPPHTVNKVVASASVVWSFSTLAEGTGGSIGPWAAAARLLDVILLAVLALTLIVLLCLYH